MFLRNRLQKSEVLCETGILLPEIPQKCHNCCAESRKSVDCQNHDLYCTHFSSHRTTHLTSQIIPFHFISQMTGKMSAWERDVFCEPLCAAAFTVHLLHIAGCVSLKALHRCVGPHPCPTCPPRTGCSPTCTCISYHFAVRVFVLASWLLRISQSWSESNWKIEKWDEMSAACSIRHMTVESH